MTRAQADAYYAEHLKRIRLAYVRSKPWQRAGIARQRMAVPNCTPNLLITSVSATEGLARAVLFRLTPLEERTLDELYESLRWWTPLRIVRAIAKLKGTKPETLLGEVDWVLFRWAIEYRNFLIHEGTFLNQMDGRRLIDATQRVFTKIEDVGRSMGLTVYGRPKPPRSR